MREDLDVLVVGAGPVGLMAAAELLRHGANVHIVDDRAEHERISKATIVMPRTLELMDVIGIADRFVDEGLKLDGLLAYSGKKKIFELTSDDIDSPYPFVISIEQFRTEAILVNHLRKFGVRVETETDLVGFTSTENGVAASLRGPDGSERTVRARYLVGCDGAHSFVRKTLGLPFEGATLTEDHFAVAYLKIEWDLPRDRILEIHAREGTVLANALPNDLWSILVELDPKQWATASHDAPTRDELQSIINERAPVAAKLSEPVWTTYYRINHRQVPKYRVGRVFLAGDAAHIHSPAGGQGMNTGLQDAINLGWKLPLLCAGKAPDSLLDTYDTERRPIAKEVLAMTTELQNELDLRNRAIMAFRDGMLHLTDHIAPARRTLARVLGELSYNYRQSSITREDTAGSSYLRHEARHPSLIDCCEDTAGPRAGDRAPVHGDGVGRTSRVGAPSRIYDLLKNGTFALFLFEGTHSKKDPELTWPNLKAVAKAVQSRHDGMIKTVVVTPSGDTPAYMDWDGPILHDADGALHHRYGARGECLYLIRPDGYIAYRSEPVDGQKLTQFLSALAHGS